MRSHPYFFEERGEDGEEEIRSLRDVYTPWMRASSCAAIS